MKKIALPLSAALVMAGAAYAAQATQSQAAKPAAPKVAAAKTHIVEAEVVSADATAKTLTIKGDPNKTVAVDAAAVGDLKSLKAGDKVKLTCRDSASGEHEAVTHIAVEHAKTTK
jgi:glucose/arabinose dehydrogenase